MTRYKTMQFCFLLLLLCSPAFAEEVARVIKVSGTGSVSAKPDRARIHMQVSHVDRSIVAAKKAVDEKVIQVQQMLLDQRVKPADINTSSLSVYEERSEPINRDGSRNKPEVYRVAREIMVKIEDLSKLDVILDSALNLGTNSVQNIEFYASGIEGLKLEALRKASDDASKKADFLARQFGCKVGKIQQIESDYKEGEVRPLALRGAMAAAPSFLQGTVEVTATVFVVFQIE